METETARCETLIELVAHYSPSGQESDAAQWLIGRMHGLGYEQAFIDEAGNAVGIRGNGTHQIILLGHIDTVPGELPVHVSDGVLYGRGAVDAKGPLAAFTDAGSQVTLPDDWQIVVIGAVEEETSSKGARFAAGQYHPDYCVVGEPNRWQRLALGYKGSAAAEITVQRGQGHSAGGSETACEAAVKLWQSIQEYAALYNEGAVRAFDQLQPSLMGMASRQDAFCQWASLTLGTRLPLKVSPQQWYEKLKELAGDAEVKTPGEAIPAWSCEKNSKLVRAFLSAIRAQGGEPAFVYKTGTADLNIVAPVWGCAALVYGPGDSALDHTPHEELALSEYLQSVTVLKSALEKVTQK